MEGTIARGNLKYNDAFATGFAATNIYTGVNPVKLTSEVLENGQNKYTVYCAPCHDQAGTGQGIINAKEPTYKPGNLHEDRIKGLADGELFWVIKNGSAGTGMVSLIPAAINEEEAWMIINYERSFCKGGEE